MQDHLFALVIRRIQIQMLFGDIPLSQYLKQSICFTRPIIYCNEGSYSSISFTRTQRITLHQMPQNP
jgi:hypothetical protein